MRPQTKSAIMMATMVNASPCASVMFLCGEPRARRGVLGGVLAHSKRYAGQSEPGTSQRALLRSARANPGYSVQSFAVHGRNGSEGGGKSMWAVRSMAAMALAAAGALQAQDYPSRPVRLIVASSSGS